MPAAASPPLRSPVNACTRCAAHSQLRTTIGHVNSTAVVAFMSSPNPSGSRSATSPAAPVAGSAHGSSCPNAVLPLASTTRRARCPSTHSCRTGRAGTVGGTAATKPGEPFRLVGCQPMTCAPPLTTAPPGSSDRQMVRWPAWARVSTSGVSVISYRPGFMQMVVSTLAARNRSHSAASVSAFGPGSMTREQVVKSASAAAAAAHEAANTASRIVVVSVYVAESRVS